MHAWFRITFIATFGIGGLILLGHDTVGYHIGTPATATVDRYTTGKDGYCSGAWSVGGQSHTGRIKGGVWPAGTTLDVHVSGDTAYSRGADNPIPLLVASILPAALLIAMFRGPEGG